MFIDDHRELLEAIVPKFDPHGIVSHAFSAVPEIELIVPPDFETFSHMKNVPRNVSLDTLAAYYKRVTRCVRCDSEGIYRGTAALEFFHYCYGKVLIAKEMIIFFSRLLCDECSVNVIPVSTIMESSIERVPLLNFIKQVEQLSVFAVHDTYEAGSVEQAAAQFSGSCAYCEQRVHLSSSSSGRLWEYEKENATKRRNVIDNYVLSQAFNDLTFFEVRAASLDSEMEMVSALPGPIARFRHRLFLSLSSNSDTSTVSSPTEQGSMVSIQFLSTFGFHAYHRHGSSTSIRPSLSFCTSECSLRFQYAASEIIRHTLGEWNSISQPVASSSSAQQEPPQWTNSQCMSDWFLARVIDSLRTVAGSRSRTRLRPSFVSKISMHSPVYFWQRKNG